MVEDFQKPFAAPPTIFGMAFLIGLAVGLIDPRPRLPLWLQLAAGTLVIASGVLLIRSSDEKH